MYNPFSWQFYVVEGVIINHVSCLLKYSPPSLQSNFLTWLIFLLLKFFKILSKMTQFHSFGLLTITFSVSLHILKSINYRCVGNFERDSCKVRLWSNLVFVRLCSENVLGTSTLLLSYIESEGLYDHFICQSTTLIGIYQIVVPREQNCPLESKVWGQ